MSELQKLKFIPFETFKGESGLMLGIIEAVHYPTLLEFQLRD